MKTGSLILDDPLEILSLAVGVFAILLFVISLHSYRQTKLASLLLVSAAFALFALKTFIHHLDVLVLNIGPSTENLLFTILDFAILILFFLSLVVRKGK